MREMKYKKEKNVFKMINLLATGHMNSRICTIKLRKGLNVTIKYYITLLRRNELKYK